jgi:hypothetical protein
MRLISTRSSRCSTRTARLIGTPIESQTNAPLPRGGRRRCAKRRLPTCGQTDTIEVVGILSIHNRCHSCGRLQSLGAGCGSKATCRRCQRQRCYRARTDWFGGGVSTMSIHEFGAVLSDPTGRNIFRFGTGSERHGGGHRIGSIIGDHEGPSGMRTFVCLRSSQYANSRAR